MKTLTLAALAMLAAAPAMAQWNSYRAPGSPYTNYTGPNGQSGTSYNAPGSPYTNHTLNGPNGQRNCTTYQAPGSPYANTTCN